MHPTLRTRATYRTDFCEMRDYDMELESSSSSESNFAIQYHAETAGVIGQTTFITIAVFIHSFLWRSTSKSWWMQQYHTAPKTASQQHTWPTSRILFEAMRKSARPLLGLYFLNISKGLTFIKSALLYDCAIFCLSDHKVFDVAC
jgi:hypothetical protein